jgi:hypothetical protein
VTITDDVKDVLTSRDRRSWIPIVEISMPSMRIRPLTGSTYAGMSIMGSRSNKGVRIEECSWPVSTSHCLKKIQALAGHNNALCVPVRPNRPTRSFAFSVNDTPWRTGGSSGAYLTTRSSTTTRASLSVLEGQYAGGRRDSIIGRGSCGRSRYSITRSTELCENSYNSQMRREVEQTCFRSSSRPVQNLNAC